LHEWQTSREIACSAQEVAVSIPWNLYPRILNLERSPRHSSECSALNILREISANLITLSSHQKTILDIIRGHFFKN
jgi:hypothetical protein